MLVLGTSCSTPGEEVGTDSGLSHVHGLGVNPADGKLYAASHHGVFRLDGDGATRQGGLQQDTMGFTVAGPDRFLASGYPDPSKDSLLRPGMRPLLGLIESTDRGVSWRSLSLLGEVDFHALVHAHDRVYGFDSTNRRFMVSMDTKQWDARSTVSLSSFAASPASPDRVVGSLADHSTVLSSDGGRTWQPSGARASFISWHRARGLWGVDATGVVLRSADEGATWTVVGKIAAVPAALLAEEQGLFVAAPEGIFVSSDASTWSRIHPR